MESDSRYKQWASTASDWLGEQVWFQQIKAKWDELDPNSRSYLKAGAMGGTLLLAFALVMSSIWSVHSLKRELNDKQDLLSLIQNANEELRKLREQTSGMPTTAAGGGAWQGYFESVATNAGIEKDRLGVGTESPGATGEATKETLYDINLKHVSVRQVVRYAFNLENGARPVKIRNLQIDTKNDPEGYMDATLSVSGFAMITK